jgi:hypothetical protein
LTFVSRAERVTTTGLLEVLLTMPEAEAAAERCIRAEAMLLDDRWRVEKESVLAVDERGVSDLQTFVVGESFGWF